MPGKNAFTKKFRPELISRRGEAIAWGTFALVVIAWLVLRISGNHVPWTVLLLAGFLLLSALSISLGNWMDRHTEIEMAEDHIHFRNGLRDVTLKWQDIREVRALPARWGKKVQVYGAKAFFEFRTLGEVTVHGDLKGRMGFERGDEILRQIVLNSGLQIVDQLDGGYYYARN